MLKRFLVCALGRLILSLRYRVEIKGLDSLKNVRPSDGGILFLPNHPAYMDPILIMMQLWPRFAVRPLVLESFYRRPWLRVLMEWIRALPMPNFWTSVNQIKLHRAERAVGEIKEGLLKGDSFLVYPAGRLKCSAREALGGTSAVHSLVEQCPRAKVVLVRTTGLWGSSFSRAQKGSKLDLNTSFWNGIKMALKNGLFFMPRRKVVIEFEVEPIDLPRGTDRNTFNRYLEKWYNRYEDSTGNILEEEPLHLVSTTFWRKKLPSIYKLNYDQEITVSKEVVAHVYSEIRKIMDKPNLELYPNMHLSYDLGMDSLQMADLMAYLYRYSKGKSLQPEDLETVHTILQFAGGERRASSAKVATPPKSWTRVSDRLAPYIPEGKTIPEVFLHCCDRMKNSIAAADDVAGAKTYQELKRSILVLSERFRTLPDEHIGVMLPASLGAFVIILAIQFAGKVPVMLNWTLGPRYLDNMVQLLHLRTVYTSWRFLERISHVDFGSVAERVELLEDLRLTLTWKEKLRGAYLSKFSATKLTSKLHLDTLLPHSPAVVLFTSGTEAAPKGVPLSHYNLLSNVRAGLSCFELKADDVLYGILPPFHSFGFSVAGLFAFLSGLKVAFYPDPTDSSVLVQGIQRWGVTLFFAAPSFLRGVLQLGTRRQLKSVRFFVTGAEKTPSDFQRILQNLHIEAEILEGYGITECSPIISLNRPYEPSKGVGRPLPNLNLCVIHLETEQVLPQGEVGEICVHGPSVFQGYLGVARASPFIEIEGQCWYRTGDIGRIDEEGYLLLSGRIKRFVKVGGEMVSLGAIEETLMHELRLAKEVPQLAICPLEEEGRQPRLILFTLEELDVKEANEILREAGFSRLVKISEVRQVPHIPLLGTGKTDYRKLIQSSKV